MIDLHSPQSTFSWLDYSDAEQRSMQQVIELFRDKDTRDELGLGTVRDALSDVLLPGTSTIQTRARYFLFVPWLCQQIAAGKGPGGGTPAERLRKIESWLIAALDRGGVGAREGLIGRRTRERTKRMPSSIYWHGLHVWGVRRWEGSIDALLRGAATASGGTLRLSDDGDYAVLDDAPWHPALPKPPERFFMFESADFNLTSTEAAFLRDTLCAAVPDSLLAWLTLNGASTDVPFLWQHPLRDRFYPRHQMQLALAEQFSTILFGASLLYGRMLAEKHPEPEMLAAIDVARADWFGGAKTAVAQWTDEAFWPVVLAVNPRIALSTRAFVMQWVNSVRQAETLAALDAPAVRHMITQRERVLKGQLARLSNPRAYDVWLRTVAGNWQPFQLDFRWQTFQRILNDILVSLEPTHAQA